MVHKLSVWQRKNGIPTGDYKAPDELAASFGVVDGRLDDETKQWVAQEVDFSAELLREKQEQAAELQREIQRERKKLRLLSTAVKLAIESAATAEE